MEHLLQLRSSLWITLVAGSSPTRRREGATWRPAWQDRHHGTTLSCRTYDALWEEEVVMFNSFAAPYESMQKRSDRFVCKLKDYSLLGMKMIGDSDRQMVLQYKSLKSRWRNIRRLDSIPLKPSCRRGLLMTIAPKVPER